jgi:tetratricopeptide (TPR) repeat protein
MAGSDGRRGSPVPPIFGRADVLAEIDRTLDRARAGAGEGLLVRGEDGSGKSFFLRASLAHARERGYRTLIGRALPHEIPQPFSLVRDLLSAPDVPAPSPATADGADAGLPIFLAPFLGDAGSERSEGIDASVAASESEGIESLLAPLDSPGEWIGTSRDELFARLTQHLADLATDRPLLVAVDDLHFADPSSLEFLARFVTKITDRPIAVVATVAEGRRIPDRAREPLESVARSTSVRSVALRPLSTPEVAEFARWLRRGLPADPADVLRWHAQTDGNPLFVEQLVRPTTGLGPRPAAPPSGGSAGLNDILLGRVRRLDDAEHRVLTYASLLGREFAFATLAAIGEMSEERLTEVLDRLVQDGLLRERGDEILEFTTDSIRATVYAELTETRRRLLHRRVGRSLEERRRASDFELARQFYLGRDDAKASEYNARAALAAMRTFAFETAVSYLERALEAERWRTDRDTGREIHYLNELGRALDELGELRRSETVLAQAVALARTRPDLDAELGRALLALAQTRQDQSEFASAEALAREAYGRLERLGSPRELMTAHRILGVVDWRLGQLPDAEMHLRLALDIAEREGTLIEQGHALVDVANAMMLGGSERFLSALALYERAAELFGTGQDLSARARVLMNRAVLLHSAGRSEEALEGLGRAIEAAERSKSPIWIGYCYLNLAQIEAELGRADRARPALERSAALLLPLGDRLGSEQIALARGLLAEAEREFDAAQGHFEDALQQARDLGAEPEVCDMYYRLAHLAHSRGDDRAARTHLAAARAAGIERHHSDLAGRIAALEADLSPPADPPR